jgi:FlaG/FlaF family flagellin (archaellin)
LEYSKRRPFRNKAGISTVIATIIIVAISIVMAIAVAYWAMGIGNSFTKFEKLEWISIYSDRLANGNFRVYVQIKNTGTAAATINNIFLDTRPYTTYPNVVQSNLMGQSVAIGATTQNAWIQLPNGGTWSSGNSVSITIETAAGRQYPNMVVLP